LTVGPQADKIVVLDQGKVAELGTHKKLLEESGIYASFVQLQSQEKKKGIEVTNEPRDHKTKNTKGTA
jgi:ABC-type transport system involved in cytochrome bd biosynthesis fused ATPase/permease subunit